FAEKRTGRTAERPELQACLDYLRPGDTLVVVSLDRLSRSLADLITLVADLRRHGVGFRSMHEALDTTTPGGRLVFHVFAALAEFIRELIVEGTREGRTRPRYPPRPATCHNPRADPSRPRPTHHDAVVLALGGGQHSASPATRSTSTCPRSPPPELYPTPTYPPRRLRQRHRPLVRAGTFPADGPHGPPPPLTRWSNVVVDLLVDLHTQCGQEGVQVFRHSRSWTLSSRFGRQRHAVFKESII
ncbi:MAG TPA: recombinase family protein, partial [Dermatophilaceae bacterium]